MRSPFPPPSLTIHIPNKQSNKITAAPAPFNIPSYSHRTVTRRPLPSRPKVTPAHFDDPAQIFPNVHYIHAPVPRRPSLARSGSWSSSQMSEDGSTLERVTSARIISSHRSNPKPDHLALGITPASLEMRERRPSDSGSSTFSLSHSSYQSRSRPASLTGTFISTSTFHPSLATAAGHTPPDCRVDVAVESEASASTSRGVGSGQQGLDLGIWNSHQPSVDLPVYSRRVVDPSTRETEADRLQRLYLCPWERTSPRTFLKFRAEAKSDHVVASERHGRARAQLDTDAMALRSENRRRKLIVGVASLLVLILFADLLLLNITLLPLAFPRD